MIQTSYSDGTTKETFAYDHAGNMYQRVDASGTTTWQFAKRNIPWDRVSTSGGGDLSYGYDAVGNMTSLTDSRGTVNYTYDSRNLLQTMTDASGKPWTFSYDDDGRRTDTYFAKTSDTAWAMHTHTAYDHSGRVTRVTTTRASDSSKVVSDLTYCYAPHGSDDTCSTDKAKDTGIRQWSKDQVSGKVSVYSYDTGNRLTKATNAAGHTYDYGYDSDGNRTSVKTDGTQTQSYTYNSANQISTSGETYDGAGNQTATASNGGWTMTYNAAGQMTQAKKGSTTAAYTYAGPDQVEMVKAGNATLVYGLGDQNGQPWIQSYQNGSTATWIERDGNGTPLGFFDGSNDYAYATDGLGSIVAVVSPSGTQAASYTYAPYGETTPDTGWEASINLLRYTGAFADPNTNFTKLGHRFDNLAQGRFTQQDTITKLADTANGNKYAYASDSPTSYIDPTGQMSTGGMLTAFLGGAALIIGGLATFGVGDALVLGAVAGVLGAPSVVYDTTCAITENCE